MMADLLINNLDAYTTYGVRMGDKFLDALGTPAPMKAYVENDSRAKHGKQVLTSSARIASRQLNLEFTIQGITPEDFRIKKNAFYSALYSGAVNICVPTNGPELYRLNYLGTSPTYAQSRNRCFCRVMVKFEEPDPTNRT
ncbi:MAG: hypothetical protein HDR77_02730 [Bacteroides sp.]|nr:hypothetical protein [Bacteroides sp.]